MYGQLRNEPWQLWKIATTDDFVDGELQADETKASLKNDKYEINSEITHQGHGVYLRKDTIKNISDKTLTFTLLHPVFTFDGGEYEIYTQYNGWQNESQGQWLPLVTQVVAATDSVRSASGAVPFMAMWNCQSNRGYAYHYMPDASWEMRAKRHYFPGENSFVDIEIGIESSNTHIELAPGEKFELGDILFYEFKNKLDMDAWKLHRYCIDTFRERKLPVIFNTWLWKFARIDFESTMAQIPAVADLGAEYFVIDAGWFGTKPGWGVNIGDWFENPNSGFKGRMMEIAESVRAHGMKFGLWFEPETADAESEAVKNYPGYYFRHGKNFFIDFANPEAADYIFKRVTAIIDQFGAEYVKFDFNSDITFDKSGNAFTKWFEGYRSFIDRVRNTYPDIYITNCASGGIRMTLSNCVQFDSFWYSDNQSPYHGMRMFRDTLLRLDPRTFERWTVIMSRDKMIPAYETEYEEHIFSTSDATWDRVVDVDMSYLKGFLSASPLGFSCDIADLGENVKKELKEHIAKFKKERDFWRNAEVRILADTPSVLIFQYNDREFNETRVQVFTNKILQRALTVYPVLNESKEYTLPDGSKKSGKEIMDEGIYTTVDGNFRMKEIVLK
ncbi:MAG: alpha-galactosidase [Clostridia bacterium]|nr:alpha-galactosidase [Clostridia bacterium]